MDASGTPTTPATSPRGPRHGARRRARAVALHAASRIALAAFGPLVAALVVRLGSEALWGEAVRAILVVQLGAHLAGWGSRELLLRAISRAPGAIGPIVRSSLAARLPLVAPLVLAAAFLFPHEIFPWICLWGLAAVITSTHEPLVLYRRSFSSALVIELVTGAATALAVVVTAPALTRVSLVLILTAAATVRAIAYTARFSRATLRGASDASAGLSTEHAGPSTSPATTARHHLVAGVPFFFLSASGLLQSRVDISVVAAFLTAADIARYQILVSLLIFVEALAAYVLTPFAPALYRAPETVRVLAARHLARFGAVVVPLAIGTFALFVPLVFGFDVSLPVALAGALYAYPIYGSLPVIYALQRDGRERTVAWVNLAGAIVVLGALPLALGPFGIAGALFVAAVVKWIQLAVYRVALTGSYAPGGAVAAPLP